MSEREWDTAAQDSDLDARWVAARAEILRLRAALEEISATFNKPMHLQGHEPAMIAYAALKRPP